MDESCETGVTAALEKIRVLESRLRQAIQNSHPLSTSFGSDPVAADRERDALLSVGCAQLSVAPPPACACALAAGVCSQSTAPPPACACKLA